jgi:hypothetical protein
MTSGSTVMTREQNRADLIWQSGFRPGARLRRFFARLIWSVLATLSLAGRAHGFATRRHT